MSNRTWTTWPEDKLAYSLGVIKKLFPNRGDVITNAQIRCQIRIARKLKEQQ